MGGTVHRLETEFLFFDTAEEHVFGVLEVVAAGLPQLVLEHSRGVNLSEPSAKILSSHQLLKSIKDPGSMGKEKHTAWGVWVDHEQFLLLAYISMIPFF